MVVPKFYITCSALQISFLWLLMCILKSWFRVSFQDHIPLEARWFWLGSANDAGKGRTSVLESEIPTSVLNGRCESHLPLKHYISLQFSLAMGLLFSDLLPFCAFLLSFQAHHPSFSPIHSPEFTDNGFFSQGTINSNFQIKGQTLIMAWRH